MDTSTIRFEIVAQYKKWLKENFLMGDSPLTLFYFLDLNGMLDVKGCHQFVDMIKKGGADE